MTASFQATLRVVGWLGSSFGALALMSCHDAIDRDQPPPGCFSVIAITRHGASPDQVREIEAVIAGVVGGSPTPAPSFIKTTTQDGRSILRSNRLLDVDPTRAFNDLREVLKSRSLIAVCDVSLKLPPGERPNNGEQGGAGQPASCSEADSEGSDEPQPEAEGRSR